jgi:heptosyltransferase-1
MGDVLHTLPAVASLKHSCPGCRLTWAIESKWAGLLEGNPFVDRVTTVKRSGPGALLETWRELRRERYDLAVDFQGLIKSALVASVARPDRIYGFHNSQVRERPAAMFYSNRVRSKAVHVVDCNLELAAAAAGAASVVRTFPVPAGQQQGALPEEPFILACPLAGWRSKQWPLEYYLELARLLWQEKGMRMVIDTPPSSVDLPISGSEAFRHFSTLPGLIFAMRRAAGFVGGDSGPLHLAAALGKAGVAIFGPTDPARNGPYGERFRVLRSPGAVTSYKRRPEIDASMLEIRPDQVMAALTTQLIKADCIQ